MNTKNQQMLELYRALSSDGISTAELISAASDMFGNPLLILDRQCRLLFGAGTGSGTETGQGSPRMPAELPSEALRPEAGYRVLEEAEPIAVALGETGIPAVLCRIRSDILIPGFAVLLGSNRAPESDDPALLAEFCGMLGGRLWGLVEREEQLSFESVLSSLLEGRLSGDRLRYQLASVGLTMKQARCLLVLQKTDGSPMHLGEIGEQLAAVYPNCRCMLYKDRLLALLKLERNRFMLPDQRARLKAYLRENSLVGGCSNGFPMMTMLPEAYQQALTVLRIGVQFPERGPINYLWEYAAYQMCDYLHGQLDLNAFCHPIIRNIVRYDAENKTHYLDTLKTYIATCCSVIRTAERMGVHRNTVDYRLDRLAELFDVDLTDAHLIYSFYLSFEILSYEAHVEREEEI